MKLFLTGGTGLLGSHVAERLRQSGHDVVALSRPGSDTTHLLGLGCTLAEGSLEDSAESHARRMEGCDALFHAAAHIYGGPSVDVVGAVNVEGTRRILQGALDAGVSRAVHVSSVAAYGDPPAPITEDLPLTAPLRKVDFYGMTKREGEGVAASFRERGLPVTIFRPPAIYGERDRLFVPKLVGFLRRPVVFVMDGGRTRLAAVYAGNVAQAAELALQGRGEGETFNVTEDVPTTLRDLFLGLGRALGRPPRFVSVPGALARAGARIGDAIGIKIPGARDLSLTRSARLASQDNPYPADKAKTVLGWDPPFTLDEALARTGAWARTLL